MYTIGPPPAPPECYVALDPVANILNSMALLHATTALPALPAWVHSAARGLKPAHHAAGQLVFGPLAAALALPQAPPTFAAYLETLGATPAETLCEQVTAALSRNPWPDPALQAAARSLLGDPPGLHTLVLGHVQALWDGLLAAEWGRVERDLAGHASTLNQGLPHDPGITPELVLHNLRLYIASQLGSASLPAGVARVVFVPSAHTGRYVTHSLVGGTLRIFFHALRTFSVVFRSSQIEPAELQGRLNALNDEMRLRILNMFANRDQISAQAVMDELGLSQSNTSRALKQLGAFLLAGRGNEKQKSYKLLPAQLELTFAAVRRTTTTLAQPTLASLAELPQYPPELRRFVNANGQITFWPTRHPDRLLVLRHLTSFFVLGREYSELEVNQLLKPLIASNGEGNDHVTLRRELYNYGYLLRERDGTRYRRAESPLAEQLFEADRQR